MYLRCYVPGEGAPRFLHDTGKQAVRTHARRKENLLRTCLSYFWHRRLLNSQKPSLSRKASSVTGLSCRDSVASCSQPRSSSAGMAVSLRHSTGTCAGVQSQR